MIGAIVGDGARLATMSLWVMALALIAKGSVGIILRVSLKETVLGVERLPRIGV